MGKRSTPAQQDVAHPWPGIRKLAGDLTWGVRLAWSISPVTVVGLCTLSLARGPLLAAIALALRRFANAVFEMAGRQTEGAVIGPILVLLCGLGLVHAGAGLGARYLAMLLREELQLRASSQLLRHTQALDIGTLADPDFLDLLHRARQASGANLMQLVPTVQTVLSSTAQLLALFAVLAVIDRVVSVGLLLLAIPYAWIHLRTALDHRAEEVRRTSIRRWVNYYFKQLTDARHAAESKILGLGGLFGERFDAMLQASARVDRRLQQRRVVLGAMLIVAATPVGWWLLNQLVGRASGGGLTVGDVLVAAGGILRVSGLIDEIAVSLAGGLTQALYVGDLRRCLTVAPRQLRPGIVPPRALRGEVVLEDVVFTYPRSREPALRGVSLRIEAGETVALVGPNGAGKTTLTMLVARLLDPTSGRLLVDGRDGREYTLPEYYQQVAVVFQHPGRYEASLAENIAYGDWNALRDNQGRIRELAKLAKVDELAESLPLGYETHLGPRFGHRDLSGGQWQRIAIARALARDAAIIVLDEPAAHLDARAEFELFAQLRTLSRGRTTLLVSHRLASISVADRIVVLDRGSVVEMGTHEDLLAQKGPYARLYELHRRRV